MTKLRKRFLISLVFAGLMALFGAGHGSMFLLSFSSPHGGHKTAEIANHCQSSCPVQLKEENYSAPIREEDKDLDPVPFALAVSPAFINMMYAVAFGVLVMAFLRRRPPDLLAVHSIYRI